MNLTRIKNVMRSTLVLQVEMPVNVQKRNAQASAAVNNRMEERSDGPFPS